jgi:hypothetical protein
VEFPVKARLQQRGGEWTASSLDGAVETTAGDEETCRREFLARYSDHTGQTWTGEDCLFYILPATRGEDQ